MPEVRLQKVLSRSGLCSRRSAEKLIADGRVSVNGETVQILGSKVDPRVDLVAVDGQPLALEPREYWMVHKPPGTIVTTDDPLGRFVVCALVETRARIYPVGRMDADSSGLLLLTNDGDLAHRLTAPDSEIVEGYEVLVAGRPDAGDIRSLRRGVRVNEEREAPFHAALLDKEAPNGATWLSTEGTGGLRSMRRALDKLGHPVRRSVRTRHGQLWLGDLPEGAARRLTLQQRRALRARAGLS
ncbi:MAG: pseudouridine synthase [Anaerolineae bacterium]